jgi:hypothetical protein
VEKDAAGAAELGDLLDREEHAGFVVRPHGRDERGVVGNGVLELTQREAAVAIDREISDAAVVALEGAAVIEDGRMLDGAGDDVAFAGIRLERGVERCCCSRSSSS